MLINDKPYVFTKQKDDFIMRFNDGPTTDLPFPNLAFCSDMPDNQGKYNFGIKSDEEIKCVRTEVINRGNRQEYTSSISSHYIDGIEQDEWCPAYSLTGQRVNEEDLRPGI